MIIVILILQLLQIIGVFILAFRYIRLANQKEHEYYTDYVHNNLVLRIYKPEYEYQAAGNIPLEYLYDRGRLSAIYDWVLIDKKGLKKK